MKFVAHGQPGAGAMFLPAGVRKRPAHQGGKPSDTPSWVHALKAGLSRLFPAEPPHGRVGSTAAGRRRLGQPRLCEMAPYERILWQGAPDWRAVAGRVFHIRVVAAYFTGLTLLDIGIIRGAEGPGLSALKAGIPTAVTGLICVGILAFLAFAVGRTTCYTLTTRRVIMQYGVALPATLMLPLHRIARADVAIHTNQSGDIVLALFPGPSVPYVKLWPHACPWRFRAPMPMLRDIPLAAIVATQMVRALTACADAKRAAERDPITPDRPVGCGHSGVRCRVPGGPPLVPGD